MRTLKEEIQELHDAWDNLVKEVVELAKYIRSRVIFNYYVILGKLWLVRYSFVTKCLWVYIWIIHKVQFPFHWMYSGILHHYDKLVKTLNDRYNNA